MMQQVHRPGRLRPANTRKYCTMNRNVSGAVAHLLGTFFPIITCGPLPHIGERSRAVAFALRKHREVSVRLEDD